MLRLTFRLTGASYTVSYLACTVSIGADVLIVDGDELAHMHLSGRWLDKHGRAWTSIDIEAVDTREAKA